MQRDLSRIEWEKIKYFKPIEFGKSELMSPKLVYLLDDFRGSMESSVIITSAYATSGHTKNSLHYQGKAVDIICPKFDLLNAFLEAERWDFTGIGLYPDWKYEGKRVGGLHLDVRVVPDGRGARWWRDGETYKALEGDAIRDLISQDIL